MRIAGSKQTCALGAAIFGAVVAGSSAGGYSDAPAAQAAMSASGRTVYAPDPDNAAVYDRLFALYMQLHDQFGIQGSSIDLSNVMKELMTIRDAAVACDASHDG